MTGAMEVIAPGNSLPGEWAGRIRAAWQKSVEGILETGRLLVEAREDLRGSFVAMVERDLPFNRQTAHRLMSIAEDPRIADVSHATHLPPSWMTLYQLTRLSDDEWEAARADGIIRPDMQRKDITRWRAEIGRPANGVVDLPANFEKCEIRDLVAAAESGRRFGCIYADPPWQYGNQGTRAATGNHYKGMTVEEIAAMPIESLCADNAHLHLWTTNAFLFDARAIMEAWGFEYKSVFVWVKPQMGIGNYWRVSHEFLLFGIRGRAPFRARDEMSWLQCERGVHSAKPERIRQKIERVSPGPYLELFARRNVEGWATWGNQIERSIFDQNIAEVA